MKNTIFGPCWGWKLFRRSGCLRSSVGADPWHHKRLALGHGCNQLSNSVVNFQASGGPALGPRICEQPQGRSKINSVVALFVRRASVNRAP